MKEKKKKGGQKMETFYITTAIHYANAGPHIGHAYEGVLADVIARYKRLLGRETFFLSGMDEHGQKIVRSAEKKGVGPQAFVDENAEKFRKLYEEVHLSNDFFIRTSDKKTHWPGAQKLWELLVKSGDIYKGVYQGLYCVGCERFITEKELVDGKCPDHGVPPEEVKEENYFFRVSKYQEKIKALIEKDELQVLPKERKEEVLSLLKKPLDDPSFSRPEGVVPWGIPVPDDESQMMYVWCDALTNYLSALGFGRKEDDTFKKFWPADVHVIGKDIIRFHAIFWPAMLISAGLPLPKTILAHGFLTSGGRKMSKSLGNVIDPEEMIKKYGSEGFRFYLCHGVSPFQDGDFTEEKFVESYNGNLAHGIGNLFARALSMAEKYFDGKVSHGDSTSVPIRQGIPGSSLGEAPTYHIPYYFEQFILPEYKERMENFEINRAIETLWQFIGVLDGYITDYEPFKLVKTDKKQTEEVLWNVLFGLSKIAEFLEPFLPETSQKMKEAFGEETGLESGAQEQSFSVKSPTEPLFQKIEE